METVQVDVQKLQLLNDRISQTIDALNQLRMTSAGLQHSTPLGYGSQQFAGVQSPFGYGQHSPFGYGQQMIGFGPQTSPWIPGLQHTTGFSPFQQAPFAQFQQSPFQSFPQPVMQGTVPAQAFGQGINHSLPINPVWQQLRQLPMPYGQYPTMVPIY